MELVFVVYLISIFDSLGGFAVVLAAILFILITGIMFGVSTDFPNESKERQIWQDKGTKSMKIGFWVVPIFTLIVFLAPDKETSYTMLAAYGVQTVSEAPEVREVMGKSVQVLEKYMDNYLEEGVDKEPESD